MTRRITIDTIRDAAAVIYEVARRTPLVKLETGTASPDDVYLKLETLQS